MALKRRTKTTASSPPANGNGFVWKEDKAQLAVDFCSNYLIHVKGEWAGRKFELDDWQVKIVREIFGWYRADGTRRYRKVFMFLPRKNGKTTLGAAIALFLEFADGEPGAEIYSVAADRDQASIMFDIARGMAEHSPAIMKRAEIYRRSIVYPAARSVYHVLSADAPSKHGKNASGILFDELHAQPTRELYDVMKTSQGSRRQPLFIMVTTAGYDRGSICWEEYEYACRVRDGIVKDDSYLPVIFEAGKDDDWKDEATWSKANPGLGKSIKTEFLREECARAQQSPAYQNAFRRLYLNQWTEQAERWLDMAVWDRNNGEILWEDYVGKPCWGGLDLASTSDITALSLVFPDEDGGFTARWWLWVPEETMIARSRKEQIRYDEWAREGWLEVTDGNTTDYDHVRQRIEQICLQYRVQEIAYDRWNASQLITQLTSDGATMVPFGQGYQSMSAPTKELHKLLLDGLFRHGGNPVLRWMASNVAVKMDPAANTKPAKDKSADKIDGIVAAIMALGRAIVSDIGGSVYDGRPEFASL